MGVGSLVVIGLVLAALLGEGGIRRHAALRAEMQGLRKAVDAVRADNQRLRAEVRALRTDPEYMEAVTRDELGWIRPRERVVHFDD